MTGDTSPGPGAIDVVPAPLCVGQGTSALMRFFFPCGGIRDRGSVSRLGGRELGAGVVLGGQSGAQSLSVHEEDDKQ